MNRRGSVLQGPIVSELERYLGSLELPWRRTEDGWSQTRGELCGEQFVDDTPPRLESTRIDAALGRSRPQHRLSHFRQLREPILRWAVARVLELLEHCINVFLWRTPVLAQPIQRVRQIRLSGVVTAGDDREVTEIELRFVHRADPLEMNRHGTGRHRSSPPVPRAIAALAGVSVLNTRVSLAASLCQNSPAKSRRNQPGPFVTSAPKRSGSRRRPTALRAGGRRRNAR